MTRLTSLLWKEWRTAQAYLWIGLGLFLGLPAIGGLQAMFQTTHRFALSTSPWVLSLGGVLAVLAAVGVTTPDLRPKVADFWRSRPIGVGPWLAAKYAVALAAVLVACTVPLAAEMAFDFRGDVADPAYLIFLPFFWTAAFSLAFAAACLIDRPAHAAVLGLAGLLLVYLVPVVVPPLHWMSVTNLGDGGSLFDSAGHGRWDLWTAELKFTGGMLALSAAAVAAAFVGVRRGWRVESGRRLLYGLVAAALLLLFASAAFQLGTNLPVLQRVELPANEHVRNVVVDGDHGYVLSQDWDRSRPVHNEAGWLQFCRSADLTPSGLVLGPPEQVSDDVAASLGPQGWSAPSRGGYAYRNSSVAVPGRDDVVDQQLRVVAVRPGYPVRTLPLWRPTAIASGAELFVWGDRLYAFGNYRLVVFDITTPGEPRQVSDERFEGYGFRLRIGAGPATFRCRLIPLPGVPAAGRAAATLAPWGFDGHLLCVWSKEDPDTLVGYRLSGLDDDTATFERVGQYRPTLLQRLVNRTAGTTASPGNGLVYVMGYSGSQTFSAGVTVLDASGPRPMRPVGHFAAPAAWFVDPLPDGRAVVGGEHTLWLVGPPTRAGG